MTVLATTELEAVNMMLAAITEAPVDSLAVDTVDDAAIALSTLREVSKEFQTEGWHFNTDYDYPLSVNGDNKIPIPVTAATVDPMDHTGKDFVERGGFLYDRENRTDVFTDITSVKCKIVWFFDFEDLPQLARTYIAMAAARRFAKNVMGDEATVQFTAEDEARARAKFEADETRRADYNLRTSTYTVSNVLRRRRTWVG